MRRRTSKQGCVILLCGLSGSGKSTLGRALVRMLRHAGVPTIHYDRTADAHGNLEIMARLGFVPPAEAGTPPLAALRTSRRKPRTRSTYLQLNQLTAAGIAQMSGHGLTLVSSYINPYRSVREWIRSNIDDRPFVEIHVATPLDVCRQRDPKGLYRGHARGELSFMPGVDMRFEPPKNPDLLVSMVDKSLVEPAAHLIARIVDAKGRPRAT
jgi:adenylylsulfate kinase